jgi:hypothetical protein
MLMHNRLNIQRYGWRCAVLSRIHILPGKENQIAGASTLQKSPLNILQVNYLLRCGS